MGYLLWARGPSSEHAAVLRAGQIVRFGRSPANDLCFLLPSVSRFHLEATLDGAFVRVRNVNTVTGFRVNDLRYDDEATVRPGDRIRLAVVSLWLEEPPGIEPASLARDGGMVPSLATAILDRHDSRVLPLSADAIEGAGCGDDRLPGGLRGAGGGMENAGGRATGRES